MTEDLTRYVDDPVGFVADVLGEAGMPYSKQIEMLEAVVEHRRVSVVGANGCGKDWAAARAVLWWIETRPDSKVVVTGPTQRQVEEIVWQEMREAFAVAEERLGGKMLASKYRIDEKRFAIGFSTNKACNIQGFHSPNLLVVVTEAHAMPQDQIDSIKRLHPNRLLLVGNAMTLEGEFYESHHSRRARYHRIKISAYDTPNFTGENGGVPGMITPEDAEELALDWSEDHPSYVAGVLAEFPNAQEDSLVGRDAVEHAMERWTDCHSERSERPLIVIPSGVKRSRGISRVRVPLRTNAP
ncbi:terminase large subunit domain-containing protein [Candidatus Palauibacter sp.]|uniref:terminase large subunit domain-containing protein n=1 Tax=Candidatus Palauibacter sp. TaxID=3101350 RepID=UPI003B02CE28